jgi:hypothetical protein
MTRSGPALGIERNLLLHRAQTLRNAHIDPLSGQFSNNLSDYQPQFWVN